MAKDFQVRIEDEDGEETVRVYSTKQAALQDYEKECTEDVTFPRCIELIEVLFQHRIK